ncbi:MAG: endonuclease/exonuclease/phosphatase family protein [Erythrobacter sp.]
MIKLTAWNAEWLDNSWGVVSGKYQPGQKVGLHKMPSAEEAQRKIDAVKDLIERVSPDILFICEGPETEDDAESFGLEVLPQHVLVKRPAGEPYHVRGRQGLWFYVRSTLAGQINPSLVPIDTWRQFAAAAGPSISPSGSWKVSIPRLRTIGGIEDVPVSERATHRFYRHPQTLRFTMAGSRHEIIGAHLKSKFTGTSVRKRREDEDFEDYAKEKRVRSFLSKAHEARVKLTSEANNVRSYIDQRFKQEADPSIFVVGDLNDGPGKELMEREYLLHDLVSNLQGEVFFAQRFLNHALFDRPGDLRWTAFFKDKLDPDRNPHILLDHIMFTQALTGGGTSPLQVRGGAGQVEHLAHEESSSLFGEENLSDHRPISVLISLRQ